MAKLQPARTHIIILDLFKVMFYGFYRGIHQHLGWYFTEQFPRIEEVDLRVWSWGCFFVMLIHKFHTWSLNHIIVISSSSSSSSSSSKSCGRMTSITVSRFWWKWGRCCRLWTEEENFSPQRHPRYNFRVCLVYFVLFYCFVLLFCYLLFCFALFCFVRLLCFVCFFVCFHLAKDPFEIHFNKSFNKIQTPSRQPVVPGRHHKILVAYLRTVDGSEIPFPTTCDV